MRALARPTERTRDARGVYVRSASSSDGEKLGSMFSRLSPGTIYEGFHMPYPHVPEWVLAQFMGAGRHDGEFLVATAGDDVVGHAMYVRRDGGRDAEIAIVVEDEWQSKGVRKLLLRKLAERARCRDVETFTGVAPAENRRVLALICYLFSGTEYKMEDGSYYFRIPLRETEQKPDPWASRPAA